MVFGSFVGLTSKGHSVRCVETDGRARNPCPNETPAGSQRKMTTKGQYPGLPSWWSYQDSRRPWVRARLD
jgi:hypothetical protein